MCRRCVRVPMHALRHIAPHAPHATHAPSLSCHIVADLIAGDLHAMGEHGVARPRVWPPGGGHRARVRCRSHVLRLCRGPHRRDRPPRQGTTLAAMVNNVVLCRSGRRTTRSVAAAQRLHRFQQHTVLTAVVSLESRPISKTHWTSSRSSAGPKSMLVQYRHKISSKVALACCSKSHSY